MDKAKKNKSGGDKFIDYVVKDMIKDIVVEEDFIRFAMPYNEKVYPSQTRIGIIINYYRWFENAVESLWHRETILEDISKMVQHHLDEAYGIPWEDTKEDNTVIPISLKLYDIIVKRLHKLWDKKSLNESKEDEYIDKIVDQLISETSIIKKKRIPRRNKSKWIYWVINPFLDVTVNFNIFWGILRNPYPADTFQKHCMEIYGSTPGQIKDIWDNYSYYLPEIKPEFNDPSKDNHWIDEGINKNLHESTGDKFLDKVVDQLVNETIINVRKKNLSLPFPNIIKIITIQPENIDRYINSRDKKVPMEITFKDFLYHRYPSININQSFTKYCREMYGLTLDESFIVFDEYVKIIKDKIKNL